jgi:hypothetical protein
LRCTRLRYQVENYKRQKFREMRVVRGPEGRDLGRESERPRRLGRESGPGGQEESHKDQKVRKKFRRTRGSGRYLEGPE